MASVIVRREADKVPKARTGDTYTKRSLRAFARSHANWISLLVVVAGLLMGFLPMAWLPQDPTAVDLSRRLLPPTWSFQPGSNFLGTDFLGRDCLFRIVFASRWTYLISMSGVAISLVIGTGAGLVAGYLGGRIDAIISRLIDVQLAFPVVLLAIAVLAVAGPSLLNLVLVLGLVDWARFARVVRASTITLRNRDFVEAAVSTGCNSRRILIQHILPNLISPIIVMTTFSAARLMLTESMLGFLGLGVTPPAVTWGAMMGAARDYITRASWTSVFPGMAISITVLAINMLGDGLRDAFDPQMTDES